MKKNITNIILIISTLLLMVIIAISFYFLQIIKNKNRHTSAVTSILQNKILSKNETDSYQKRISELSDIQSKIDSYFINTPELNSFIELLEDIGSQNDVDLSVEQVNIPKDESHKISINLNLGGSFSNITKVITLLENLPYSIKINSLYLNKIVNQNTNKTESSKLNPSRSSWQASINITILNFSK